MHGANMKNDCNYLQWLLFLLAVGGSWRRVCGNGKQWHCTALCREYLALAAVSGGIFLQGPCSPTPGTPSPPSQGKTSPLPWIGALNYNKVMFNNDTHKCSELGGSCIWKCSDYLSMHGYALLYKTYYEPHCRMVVGFSGLILSTFWSTTFKYTTVSPSCSLPFCQSFFHFMLHYLRFWESTFKSSKKI